jgi:hypothetical protein
MSAHATRLRQQDECAYSMLIPSCIKAVLATLKSLPSRTYTSLIAFSSSSPLLHLASPATIDHPPSAHSSTHSNSQPA